MMLKLAMTKEQYEMYNKGAFHKREDSEADAFHMKVIRAVEAMHVAGLVAGLPLGGCVEIVPDPA